jgi:hypothetical protein
MAGFAAATLSGEQFHHRDHIKMAWLYLSRYPVLEALAKFCEDLKRFAAAHGKPDLYHETITWAFVFLIHERRALCGREQSWDEFAEANADLFTWQGGILDRYYDKETLWSEFARKVFVLPKMNVISTRDALGERRA